MLRRAARKAGKQFEFVRRGKKHDLYRIDGTKVPIPRHSEISPGLTESILHDMEAELGEDWWR
jgi:hypothetical protein